MPWGYHHCCFPLIFALLLLEHSQHVAPHHALTSARLLLFAFEGIAGLSPVGLQTPEDGTENGFQPVGLRTGTGPNSVVGGAWLAETLWS